MYILSIEFIHGWYWFLKASQPGSDTDSLSAEHECPISSFLNLVQFCIIENLYFSVFSIFNAQSVPTST